VAPNANKAPGVTESPSNFAISSNGFHKVISNKLHATPESSPMIRGLVNKPYEVLAMTVGIGALPLLPISSMMVKSGSIMRPCVPIITNKGNVAHSPKASKITGIPSSTVFEKQPEKALITLSEKVRFQNTQVMKNPVNNTVNVPK